MSQSIKINNVTYSNVPYVEIPLAEGSGNAEFYDTSDATLNDASNLPSGVTAYAAGVKYTGTAAENDGDDLTVSGDTVTVPAGFYAAQATKAVASGAVTAPSTISDSSATLTTGTNTLTVSKTISVTPSVTTAGYVSAGTAGNASVSLTASVTTKAAATITPGTSDQTISSGTYLTGTLQSVKKKLSVVISNSSVSS